MRMRKRTAPAAMIPPMAALLRGLLEPEDDFVSVVPGQGLEVQLVLLVLVALPEVGVEGL